MRIAAYSLVAICAAVWAWPFFHAHRGPKSRAVATRTAPSVAGLALQTLGYAIALTHFAAAGPFRLALSVLLAAGAPALSWTAVRHLGKQWRIQAGLYQDHELVRTGPYALVRHPVYASMLLLLLSALCLGTRWPWPLAALAVFVAGTELRVRAEDALLRGAFGRNFEEYRARVPAYLPFLR